MDKNYLANQATDNLDDITREGFFGDVAAELLEKRDAVPRNDFLYDSISKIFNSNNDGRQGVAGITLRLVDLYCEAIPHKPQEVIDVLNSFIMGTDVNPELENMSSYLEYMTAHQGWKNFFAEHAGQVLTDAQKRQQAMSILEAYTKGVEFVGKVFTQLIAVEKIRREEPYDIYKIARLTIYKKLEEFKKISEPKFHILTDIIDRKIRNADSHLNATYSPKNEEYTMKSTNRNGGIDIFRISIREMLFIIYPKVGAFVQAFYSSCILMTFNWSDRELAQKTAKNIAEINNGCYVEW